MNLLSIAADTDTKLFTGHSTEIASTSKAKTLGILFKNMANRRSWSNKSNWQRHYNISLFTEV